MERNKRKKTTNDNNVLILCYFDLENACEKFFYCVRLRTVFDLSVIQIDKGRKMEYVIKETADVCIYFSFFENFRPISFILFTSNLLRSISN